jgi:hypothetical protein
MSDSQGSENVMLSGQPWFSLFHRDHIMMFTVGCPGNRRFACTAAAGLDSDYLIVESYSRAGNSNSVASRR